MTRLVGLTGGIACGKSVVASYLHGLPLIDCDVIARECTRKVRSAMLLGRVQCLLVLWLWQGVSPVCVTRLQRDFISATSKTVHNSTAAGFMGMETSQACI